MARTVRAMGSGSISTLFEHMAMNKCNSENKNNATFVFRSFLYSSP